MNEFTGKWAVIVGGSNGLGWATAKKLARHGMNLCLVHRDRKSDLDEFYQNIEALKKHQIEIQTFNKNGLLQKEMEEIVQNLPENGVYLLLHSIAKGSLKPIGNSENNLTTEDFQITMHAMGLNWYEWGKLLLQHKKFSEKARNIAFTSEGNQKVWPAYGAVSAAKSVLESLLRQMAVEWAKNGIRTNCVQAGTTMTASFQAIPNHQILIEKTLERNPFGRMTTAEDVARAVYLLCKKEADWINGTILKADGGESLR